MRLLCTLRYHDELHQEGDRKYTARIEGYPALAVPISREKLDELKERLGIV